MGIAEFLAAILNPQTGLLALLGIAVYVLARDHRKNVDEAKTERISKLEALLDVATAGWTAQTAANAQGAEAQDATARAVEQIAADIRRERAAKTKASGRA